ncbi:hypothetical protein [Enteractinococcus helveticum]|uniref:Uncharacterized protein n=1 Tax=Enteractinococcus helveticum TaxID=1837282 RepID=A0A1B7LYA3_9MICC|nr:hypothetical protein [Enteractinococcus helveticum]OAV60279.1 hypothetical protein A6F49_12970 [Enteractinococcus helveticum]
MIRDGKPANFSGEGNTAGNWLIFVITVILFVVGLYMFNLLSFENVWVPMLGVLILTSVAYFIPKQIIGRSNTVDAEFVTDPAHETNSPNL